MPGLKKRMILKPCLLITFAIARQVANFPNSAGCIRIPPISNHERAPWDSTPKTSTAAKKSDRQSIDHKRKSGKKFTVGK